MTGRITKWQCIVLIGVLAGSGLLFSWSLRRSSDAVGPPQRAFYTVDDGANLFIDSVTKLVPFDHDGHPAVKALVFSADNGVHRWVQYLFRYTDAEKASLSAFPDASASAAMGEVKRPGSDTWYTMNDPHVADITFPKTPAGMGSGVGAQVFP